MERNISRKSAVPLTKEEGEEKHVQEDNFSFFF